MAEDILFSEKQRFRQPLLWAMLFLIAALQIGFSGPALVSQLVLLRTYGTHLRPDTGLIAVGVCAIFFSVALLAVFWFVELVTEVRSDGVYSKFRLLQRRPRRLLWADIKSFESVTYRAVREYGGWGIRLGREGVAYTVSGSRGVRFKQVSGGHVLIGSQRPDEFVEAVRLARRGAKHR